MNKKAVQFIGAASIILGAFDLRASTQTEDEQEQMGLKLMGIGAMICGLGCIVLSNTLEAGTSEIGGGGGNSGDPVGPFDPDPDGQELPLMVDDNADFDPDDGDVPAVTDDALAQVMGEAEQELEDEEAALRLADSDLA